MSKIKQSEAPEGAMRIQKFLSLAGVASRRHAEEMIAEGRVKVSGRVVTEPGTAVVPGKSRVEVDNKPVFYSEERNYILFYKPSECITTLDDPEHRTTVIDLLPKGLPRVFPVGRLDWDTEGLLLLTNDGDLAYRLTHPGSKVPRVYQAKVRGELKDGSPEFKKLQNGIELDDGFAKPDRVSVIKFTGNNTWIEIELHIGRNRIVRRLCEAIGYPVMKLRRVAFGNLTLDGLSLGAYRDLTPEEVASLYEQIGDLGSVPVVRSKSGVRFARGFAPKERTKVRQSAPSKEELERRDAERAPRVDRRPRPSRIKIEDSADKRRTPRLGRKFGNPPENRHFERDESRRFASSWDGGDREDAVRSDRKPFSRGDRDERKSFPRGDRDERKSFPRGDREERRAFPRGGRDERKSFPRADRDERKSFPRADRDERGAFPRGDRDERKSFPRGDREERRAFPRGDRDERKSFPRADRDERKSFPRGDRDERKSFPRGDREERRAFPRGGRDERKSFPRADRDERKSFPRADRDERGAFPRGDRDERKSFPRGDREERRAFPRGDRDERKSFPRADRDERKSFPRGDRDERKSFPRGDREERKSFPRGDRDERKSFSRDDHRPARGTAGKKRPFAGGMKPKTGPRGR